jgi:hypothetical protein
MSEQEHGWPEGCGWEEYLAGQMMLARVKRAEENLVNEMATMEDKVERERALAAWPGLRCANTQMMTKTLAELGAPGYGHVNVSTLFPLREGKKEVHWFAI